MRESEFVHLLGDVYYQKIVDSVFANSKLELLARPHVYTFLTLHDFSGYHVFKIFSGTEWYEKIMWLLDHYESELCSLGFCSATSSHILARAFWSEKIDLIKKYYHSHCVSIGMTPSHISLLLAGSEYKERLQWVLFNYLQIMKPLRFSIGQTVDVVKSSEWKEKVDWISTSYTSSVLKNQKPSFSKNILMQKEWRRMIG